MSYALILSTVLGLAAAQTTTISVPFIGYDAFPIHASVVNVNGDASTFSLGCLPTSAGCGLFPAQTLIYGPKTYNMYMGDPLPGSDFTASQDCKFESSTAVCMESATGSEANFPGSSTETYEAESITTFAITVTAGAEKLTAKGGASQTGASGSVAPSQTASAGSLSGSAGPSKTSSLPVQSTNAAAGNVVVGSGFVVAAAGVVGGMFF